MVLADPSKRPYGELIKKGSLSDKPLHLQTAPFDFDQENHAQGAYYLES